MVGFENARGFEYRRGHDAVHRPTIDDSSHSWPSWELP